VPPERGNWREFYRILRHGIESDSTASRIPMPMPVPAREARAVIRLIEAARESSASGSRLQL